MTKKNKKQKKTNKKQKRKNPQKTTIISPETCLKKSCHNKTEHNL